MSTTFIHAGLVQTFTAPSGGVTAGTPVLIGALLVVPRDTAAVGVLFAGDAAGMHQNMPKATGATWSEGQLLYWDDTAKKFTPTATSNTRAGCAGATAASGDTTGTVRLNGAAAPAGTA